MRVSTTTTAAAGLVAVLSSPVAVGFPLIGRQLEGLNICQAVQNAPNGCIESAAVSPDPIFFTCANGTQTLFTCDGGCRQDNAANLPTCDNGVLFNTMVIKRVVNMST